MLGDGSTDGGHDRCQDKGDQHGHGEEAELLGGRPDQPSTS